MRTCRRIHLFFILVLCSCCASSQAKIINTDASSSWLAKRAIGVQQSITWMKEYIAPSPPSRSPRKVQLALVGLGRTGSTSFSVALKKLGYAPIHDDEATEVADIYGKMMTEEWNMDQVNEALGERGFDAPMVSTHKYVKWAATTSNDVKVILTVRNPKKWAQSWLSITPAAFLPRQRPFKWVKAIRDLDAFNWEVMVTVPTNGHPDLYNDVQILEAGYEAWVEYVKRTVPSDRLLVFDVRQGWEPLCSFLGKDVPEEPFPHINDRVVVDTIVKFFIIVTWIWPIIFALPLAVVSYFVFGRRKRKKKEAE